MTQEIADTQADPTTSFWLQKALREALSRDPLDAVNDAFRLASLLDAHCKAVLGPSV